MANILDIFRTQSGGKLLARSIKITKLETKVIENTFIFMFPALLCHFRKNGEGEIYNETEDLIDLIENGDLINLGKAKTESLFTDTQQQIFLQYSQILSIDENKFQKILFITGAVLTVIISEMKKTNNSNLSEILNTLSGVSTKCNHEFIGVLIKNPDDPNLIDSSEEIALSDNKKDDPSILGGYAGGR